MALCSSFSNALQQLPLQFSYQRGGFQHQNRFLTLLRPKLHESTAPREYHRLVVSGKSSEHRPKGFKMQAAGAVDSGTSVIPPEEIVASGLELESEKFDWAAHWYPAAIARDLEKNIPKAVTILGRKMVIWWDRNEKKWQCFADMCPHRLAPLSEGRIHESGQLQCSYHGWVFGSDGSCKLIPQAPENSTAKDSPRACARVYPCAEHQGMVWVWPEIGPEALTKASANPIPTVPEMDDPDFTYDFGFRDLPYSWDALVENLVDPAHVHFAHHNIQGDRNKARPLPLSITRIHKEGFEGTGGFEGKFIAPCLFIYDMKLPPQPPKKGWFDFGAKKNEEKQKIKRYIPAFYCVPVAPGQSKVFYVFLSNFLPKFMSFVPAWMMHVYRNLVLDSDLYFLHIQERILEERGGTDDFFRACYTPTDSDKFIIAFRQWLKKFANSGPDYGPFIKPGLPPTPSKEILMDRQKSHVQQCKACRGAETNLNRLCVALWVSSALIQCTLVFLALSRAPPPQSITLLCMAASAAFAFAAFMLKRFIYRAFHFHDYIHALV